MLYTINLCNLTLNLIFLKILFSGSGVEMLASFIMDSRSFKEKLKKKKSIFGHYWVIIEKFFFLA